MGNLLFYKAFLTASLPDVTESQPISENAGPDVDISGSDSSSNIVDSDVSSELLESGETVVESEVSTEPIEVNTEVVEDIPIPDSTEILEDETDGNEIEPIEDIIGSDSEDISELLPDMVAEDEVEPYASSNDYYTYLPTWADDYFQGVLENIGDTEYLAYAYREYSSNSNYTYTDYYRLIYDINVVDGNAVSGTYPCIELVRYNNSGGYYTNVTSVSSVPIPTIGYASYGLYSDLRGGMGYVETYTLLFAVGFAIVYGICTRIFDCIRGFGSRKL